MIDNRKKKFLLALPVLLIPFITLAFWALGGGKSNVVQDSHGLDTNLPGANLSSDPKDKLAFYDRADADSDKLKQLLQQDPYLKNQVTSEDHDSNEAKVYARIDEINAAMHDATTRKMPSHEIPQYQDKIPSQDEIAPDPQVTQLNTMLDKVIKIQHPGKDSVQKEYPSGHTVSLATVDSLSQSNSNQFYSLEQASILDDHTIRAAVFGDQTIVAGGVLKLCLIADIVVNKILIEKGSFIYGVTSLEGERLKLTVTGIRNGSDILPVHLAAYDIDGMEGINAPGAAGRETIKQSGGNSIQQLGISNVDPSIGVQAADAGIEAAKNIIGKKVRLTHITIRSGYLIFLKN